MLDDLIIGFGYRYEEAKFEGDKTQILVGGGGSAFTSEEKTHYEDALDISFTWLLEERSKIYGKFSTLYRYPFTDEQVNYNGWADGFNTNLNAETGKSYEIGGVYSPIKGLDIGLTFFQIDMEDEITWDDTINRNINLDETRHRGIEFSIFYNQKDLLNFNFNYSYHEAEFQKGQYNGKDIPIVPNHHLSTVLDFLLPYNIHLCPEMVYVSTSYLGNDFNNSSEKISDYMVFNLLSRYSCKWKSRNITAFLGAKNIFDKDYETWGFENDPNDGAAPANTYYPAKGREFTGGVSLLF